MVDFCFSLLARIRPEALVLLLAVLGQYVLQIGFLVALGLGLIKWGNRTRSWLIPASICAAFVTASFFAAAPLARMISDWEFRLHVDEYQGFVDRAQSGSLSCPSDCRTLMMPVKTQSQLPTRTAEVLLRQCDQGFVMAFLGDSDVPLFHAGYMFRGAADLACMSDSMRAAGARYYLRHVSGHWYRFSDRPGF